ncbi:MAG: sulfatase/phosphatase domain-containing protein [Terriglobia bacterium]
MGNENKLTEPENSSPSRREFLKTGAQALGGLAVASALPHSAAATPDVPRPNFVFYLGEGVRADEFSSTGNKIISTPHLDRVVREGMNFPNAFVINALCLPSRATILTGLYSHTTGCIDNGDVYRHPPRGSLASNPNEYTGSHGRALPPGLPTFADTLRDAGYEIALIGKAHIMGAAKRDWDYYFGIEAAAANYYDPVITESAKGIVKSEKAYQGYVDDIFTDRALAWLNQEHKKPFCLFLWFIAPHGPFYRPRRYLDLYDGVDIPKPPTFDDDLKGYPGKPFFFKYTTNKIGTTVFAGDAARSLEELVKDHYVGVVTNDDCMGRIFDALERTGKMDDTVIVVSADHGYFLGEWRFYDKRFMYEPSIRVPLAIRYPRLIRPGVRQEMALNLDIAPTILELAGLKVPEWMQGRSLVPFLKGSEPPQWRKDWLYEYYEYPAPDMVPKHRGVRTDRYKLIDYWEAPEIFELYDLQEDPLERHNLYGFSGYAKLAEHLRDRIRQLRIETRDVFEQEEYQ